MYKHLYDCFKHWYRGGQILIYSDPHFSDPEMKYLRKNYIGDEEQIKSINKHVGKKDTLIILGDIGNKDCLKKIKGYKVLVLGNHDKGATIYKEYADEVYEGMLLISDNILLSHEPVNCPFALNIHGHDHSGKQYRDNFHINCCAEHINYTPVAFKHIVESGILKNIPNIHRVTIDQATDRKLKQN